MNIKDLTNVSILAIRALIQNSERFDLDLDGTSMSIKSTKSNVLSENISLGIFSNQVLDRLHELKGLSDTHVFVPKEKIESLIDGLNSAFQSNPTLTLGDLLPLQQDFQEILEAQEQANGI